MKFFLIFIFLLTISCSNNKVIKSHGSPALELKVDKILVNKSNKNDVLNILGKPSTKSFFNDNIWVYINREKENQSVFKLGKSKIKTNNVLEISFNNYGIVETKKLYNINDMNKIKISKDITSKTYDDKKYINKVLTSIKNKINAPKLNRKR